MNYCNPINVNYHYQFNQHPIDGTFKINREAADPSMIFFQGKYFIFASMNLSVWVSDDLVNWKTHRLPENLPLYDYAPDARVCGEYVYFCASKAKEVCHFYRTKDIINGPYEEIPGTFDFWDPNLYFDDDGRVYFYWGCSSNTPIWGVELDPETLIAKSEPIGLISGNPWLLGYERVGDDNSLFPASEEEIERKYQDYIRQSGKPESEMDVRAIQINFADDHPNIPCPGEIRRSKIQLRYIEENELVTRWLLEGSLDGEQYFVIEDKSQVTTDLPHDLVVRENGIQVRYIKLTILEVPYQQTPCISGLRVFGTGSGDKPGVPEYIAGRSEDRLDLMVSIIGENAVGYNILWGHERDKLYHSCLVYHDRENQHTNKEISKRIGALVNEQDYYVRVDAFNECGITEGVIEKLT